MAKRATLLMSLLVSMFLLSLGSNAFGQDQANIKDSTPKPYVTAEMITLPVQGDYEYFKLTVKGPNDLHFEYEFSGQNVPIIEAYGPNGDLLEDGAYAYQLEMIAKMSDDAIDALRHARITGDMTEIEAMRNSGEMPAKTEPKFGYFTIKDGAIVVPGAVELSSEQLRAKNDGRDPKEQPGDPVNGEDPVIGDVGDIDTDSGIRDQVIGDDLIVSMSICVGMDCNNGESFGFDTIKLKENNLRIKFDDTSNSGSFPNFDWQLTANESDNGGANKFSIDDITSGRTPFTIEGTAPSNSLYVDDGGRIGLGTMTPSVEIHVKDGDTPTLRLEQDQSSGFGAQTWDVAGNETNYFVRDASNGSKIPFKIIPNAPTNSLYVNSNGNIGLGTASPDQRLDLDGGSADVTAIIQTGGSGSPQLQILQDGTTASRREMFFLSNYGEPAFRFSNTDPSAADDWSMILLDSDEFLISRNGSGVNEMQISNGGNLTIAGALTEGSDVNSKENFEEVDPIEVLDRVLDLPISTWNYIHDEDSVRHMGPMAQDFAAAFGLGKDERRLAGLDVNGVTIAAIKGLNQRLQDKEADLIEKEETIQSLQKQNEDLNKRLENLEAMVQALVKKSN